MVSFTITVALIGAVIIVASLLSGVLEKTGLPLVAVFLALGAALGPYGLDIVDIGFESPALLALSMLALALVLFSDAVTVDRRDVRDRRPLIIRMLGPGTIVPALIVGLAGSVLLDLPWPACLILGAALASTDPVLLRSVIRSRALGETSRTALRMESGMNDVVLLPIVVLSMLALPTATGTHPTGAGVVEHVIGLFLLGPGLGALVGWLGIVLLGQIREKIGVRRDYESLYAIGLALTGFALAEEAGGSGFLAAFAAGLMVSWQDVELCDCFLEYGEATAEMLLLLTFVALGTSLIWTGLEIISWRTLLFTAIALSARTIVLYPVLARAHVSGTDRRIIALFGPRGLSSLLLVLLPVFAGVQGARQLFSVVCLVVLASVVLHGGGIALFLRRAARETSAALPIVEPVAAPQGPATITIPEYLDLRDRGEEVLVVDVRRERNLRDSDSQAAGAIRLRPDDPVRDATEKRLSQLATLVVYCA